MFQAFFQAPYESRKVARSEFDWGFISTANVNDGAQPFETAVEHPEYNGGEMVIVEAYPDRATAKQGHEKWVATMTAATLPESLTDCENSELQQFCSALGDKPVYPRKSV